MKSLETDKELTDLIVKTLEVHEEHYVLGSWENFVKMRARRRRLIFWITSTGIAAAFLAGWMGFRILFPEVNTPAVNVARNTTTAVAGDEKPLAADSHKGNEVVKQDAGVNMETVRPVNVFKAEGLSEYNRKDEPLAGEVLQRENSGLGSISGLSFSYTIRQDASLRNNRDNPVPENHGDKFVSLKDTTEFIPYDEPLTHEKKFRFGINVSPGVTSTSTAASYNYAGGVNADIVLAHNLSISTGLQVEHQSVITKSTDGPSWVPQAQSRALLTALDLPVNIMWKFISKKTSSYYIASGVSSVAWLGEKYVNTTYTQKMNTVVNMVGGTPNVSYQLENVSNTSKRSETPLSTFDFAGRVNIIFGYEQNMSSNLRLHVEPYLKIPLSGQAAENLKYTISGITCKISF